MVWSIGYKEKGTWLMYLTYFTVSNILKFSMVESEGANKLYSTPFLLSFEPINRDKKKKVKQIKTLNNISFLRLNSRIWFIHFYHNQQWKAIGVPLRQSLQRWQLHSRTEHNVCLLQVAGSQRGNGLGERHCSGHPPNLLCPFFFHREE